MDLDEFDEFGNPIGGSNSETSDSESTTSESSQISIESDEPSSNQVLRQEDINQPFGSDVETIIATTDAQDITKPIVEPSEVEKFKIEEKSLPETSYSKQYMWNIAQVPSRVRNIAICGGLHSGKTSFVDMLVEETHSLPKQKRNKHLRYTDNEILETKRGISVKTSTMSLLLPTISGVSYVFNICDTPGHSNFLDEVDSGMRLCDAALIIVDAAEGVNEPLKHIIRLAFHLKLSMFLMISKLDRLVMELRLPPVDAYYNIRKTIDDVNDIIIKEGISSDEYFDPLKGNVCFESSNLHLCFTLQSFASNYVEKRKELKKVPVGKLANLLWGDVYFEGGKFVRKAENNISKAASRSFIKLILEPIYKIITQCLTLDSSKLEMFVRDQLHIYSIKHHQFKLDPHEILQLIISKFIGSASTPFADMLANYGPSPVEARKELPSNIMPEVESKISQCNPTGPVIAYISRLVSSVEGKHFYAEVRVLSGTLRSSSDVVLLGEDYTSSLTDDMKVQNIKKVFLCCGRYKIHVAGLPAGSIGLISGHGIDTFITKSATIYDRDFFQPAMKPFKPLQHLIQPVFKVAVQPENPSEMGKLIEGLRRTHQAYPGCEILVEEGGDQAIIGYGELYMDCLLHDLRKLYAKVEIKVSDPMTRFAETCDNMSMVKLDIKSNNDQNQITIVAEPLDERLASDIEKGNLNIRLSSRKLAKLLRKTYGWDSLAARSVLSFGPLENHSVAVLCNDTLPDEVDEKRLKSVKDSIIQGFKWACRSGPICDEPIRNVKFRIIDAKISSNPMEANNAQIIQMTKQACHAALMTALPRLMEPIYEIEISCNDEISRKLSPLLDRRRGRIIGRSPVHGTPLCKVIGLVPVIESFGLETDIRLGTQGKAMCEMIFSNWELTPGNPLDKSCYIPILKPAPLNSLARDFTMKTRKRKGLEGNPSLQPLVDSVTWSKLQETGLFV